MLKIDITIKELKELIELTQNEELKNKLMRTLRGVQDVEIEGVKTYLIDVKGYSEDDLDNLTKFELYDLVTDIKEMNAYILN